MSSNKKRRVLKERRTIALFVDAMADKNYAQANKYLQNVVQRRLKQRISKQLDKPLF